MNKYAEILAKHKDRFLEDCFTFLRFPSASADPALAHNLQDCADWLIEIIARMGGKVEK